MKALLAAIRFLTIVPLPGKLGTAEDDLARSVAWFPAVGVLIGAAAGALAFALNACLPAWPAAVLVALFLTAISGGMHMDGVADTADGFFCRRDRARMLEIMRDSRIGPMGVMGVVFVVLLKVSLLAALFERAGYAVWLPGVAGSLPVYVLAVAALPIAGRAALAVTMCALPYVRAEGGLATLFYRRRSWTGAVAGVLLLAAAGWLAASWPGLIAAGATLVFILLFAAYCRRKIGGATGDTLGAACELAETFMALALVVAR